MSFDIGENVDSQLIEMSNLLAIYVNGVLQDPEVAYNFGGGTTFEFTTAPDANDDFWGHVHASNTVTFDISDNDIDNFTGDGSTANFNLSKTPQ